MSVRPIFAWYDIWVGAFWDRQKRRLYILPLPCMGVVIQFESEERGTMSERLARWLWKWWVAMTPLWEDDANKQERGR